MRFLFLVHFVEDIHQPMHVGDDGDRGGKRHPGPVLQRRHEPAQALGFRPDPPGRRQRRGLDRPGSNARSPLRWPRRSGPRARSTTGPRRRSRPPSSPIKTARRAPPRPSPAGSSSTRPIVRRVEPILKQQMARASVPPGQRAERGVQVSGPSKPSDQARAEPPRSDRGGRPRSSRGPGPRRRWWSARGPACRVEELGLGRPSPSRRSGGSSATGGPGRLPVLNVALGLRNIEIEPVVESMYWPVWSWTSGTPKASINSWATLWATIHSS